MREKISKTCKQLIAGIIIVNIIFIIGGSILAQVAVGCGLSFALGVFLGGVLAVILALHMDYSIANALQRDSLGATKYMRRKSAIRSLIMVAVLVLALTFPRVFNIIGVLLGILALKFSAYLQPLASKYINKTK